MAALYGIPVLFILENNHYAMGTSVERSTVQTDFLKKANAYGIEGERIDGMDVISLRENATRILEKMRKESKPYFLDIACYRYQGHGVADNPQQQRFYRSDEEIEEWKARDPIFLLQSYMEKNSMLDAKESGMIEDEVRRTVEDAIAYAERSPEPAPDSLYENVFSD
jgi:pyruvate dehydrogenase E1 component alpha subunit